MRNPKYIPLADRMRPRSFDHFFGQAELTAKDSYLRKIIENDAIFSMIFWGPPGSGKTTLAEIIARETKADFIKVSAVDSGAKKLREVLLRAEKNLTENKRTILFLDEIHRWNKAQQDKLLPYLEKGTLILIGATTENPSFEINSALLSRARVFVLHKLETEDLKKIIREALGNKERG